MEAFKGTISGSGYGYVYVMSYPGSDNVKIGHTLNPTTRVVDIGGTQSPEEPVVEILFWCSERREEVERRAHAIQSAKRHRGEWFTISINEAAETLRRAAAELAIEIQLVFDRVGHEERLRAEKDEERQRWESLPLDELIGIRKDMHDQRLQEAIRRWSQVRSTRRRGDTRLDDDFLDDAYKAAGGDALDQIIDKKEKQEALRRQLLGRLDRLLRSLPVEDPRRALLTRFATLDNSEVKHHINALESEVKVSDDARATPNRLSESLRTDLSTKSVGRLIGERLRRVRESAVPNVLKVFLIAATIWACALLVVFLSS